MINDIDVMVIGSDISSVVAASLLSKKGFRVALVDDARSFGGNYCYIPMSLNWLNKLGLDLNDSKIIKRIIDKLNLSINFAKNNIRSILNFRLALLDVAGFCNEFARDSDLLFNLWSQLLIKEKTVNEIKAVIKSPSGELDVKTRLLIRSMPASGEITFKVSTGTVTDATLADSLVIDHSGINLYIKHGNLLTGVLTSHNSQFSSCISSIEIPWGGKKELSVGPIMKFGPSAGHSVPPWVGDYLVKSALMAYEVASSYLEGKEDESILRKYLDFLSMVDMCKILHEYSINGKMHELPVSFVSEALKPLI